MKRSVTILTGASLSICCLWVLGIVFSDRWAWSQWLAWIPTIVVLVLMLIAAIIAACTTLRLQMFVLSVIAGALFCWLTLIENSLFHDSSASGDLRIVGWTMSHPKKNISDQSALEVVQFDGDITLLTHGWYVRGELAINEWLGNDGHKLISGPFTVLTKLQPIEVRTIIASDGIYISLFVLDATPMLGRTITMWAIDLPSNVGEPKMKVVARTLRLLDKVNVPPPDIVVGDFNMTRNSVAMRTLFPSLHDASDDSASGWLASYPRTLPIYHIDHTLISDTLIAINYKLINPHLGRHRVQLTELKRID